MGAAPGGGEVPGGGAGCGPAWPGNGAAPGGDEDGGEAAPAGGGPALPLPGLLAGCAEAFEAPSARAATATRDSDRGADERAIRALIIRIYPRDRARRCLRR